MEHLPLVPRRFRFALAAAALFNCVIAGPAAADAAVRVVATIKPVQSLVSAVMAGVGEPHLIMRGTASPHTFSLRPSDARVLEEAHVIFLIGESMETSLAGPIDSRAGRAKSRPRRWCAIGWCSNLIHLYDAGLVGYHA